MKNEKTKHITKKNNNKSLIDLRYEIRIWSLKCENSRTISRKMILLESFVWRMFGTDRMAIFTFNDWIVRDGETYPVLIVHIALTKYLIAKCEFQLFLFEQIRKKEKIEKIWNTVNQSFHFIPFWRLLFSVGFVNCFHHSMPSTLTVYVNNL